MKAIQFYQPYNSRSRHWYKHTNYTNLFTYILINKTFKIYHQSNCNNKNISYLFEGIRCNKQYIGKSESPFRSCVRLEDWGSIPGRVMPKTQKMVLAAALLNTQHYKAPIKG